VFVGSHTLSDRHSITLYKISTVNKTAMSTSNHTPNNEVKSPVFWVHKADIDYVSSA